MAEGVVIFYSQRLKEMKDIVFGNRLQHGVALQTAGKQCKLAGKAK